MDKASFDTLYTQYQTMQALPGNRVALWHRYIMNNGWVYIEWIAELKSQKNEDSVF